MGSIPAYISDVSHKDGHVMIDIINTGVDRKAMRKLGGRQEYLWWGRWIFSIRDDRALGDLLGALRDLGLLFVGVGHGWDPGAVFEDLRDRGFVTGSYRKIFWTGPGQWQIRDG